MSQKGPVRITAAGQLAACRQNGVAKVAAQGLYECHGGAKPLNGEPCPFRAGWRFGTNMSVETCNASPLFAKDSPKGSETIMK